VVCTPVYFTLGVVRFFLPLLWMRGSASSSPGIFRQLVQREIDSSSAVPPPAPPALPSPSTARSEHVPGLAVALPHAP